jgi:hypothetical protein
MPNLFVRYPTWRKPPPRQFCPQIMVVRPQTILSFIWLGHVWGSPSVFSWSFSLHFRRVCAILTPFAIACVTVTVIVRILNC